MVEKLYPSAAPKLLKTLEEPENKTLFILLAENSDNILPTILSRTQLVKIPVLNKTQSSLNWLRSIISVKKWLLYCGNR
jgi:DNA polymerase-3 subunit delta'